MNIDIKVTAELVANVIEEYCSTHICPTDCPFDAIGVCTEQNPFNCVKDKFEKGKNAKKEHPAVWDVDYCSGGERKEMQDENV